jgi:hypothetical protein
MMDTSDWKCLYKKDYINRNDDVPTNMLYTPLINPEGTIMCMLWDASHPYQIDSVLLTNELVNFCFEREVKHLTLMQKFSWAPKIISIEKNRIYVEFNKETLNHIVLNPDRNIDTECPNWKEQIFNIIKDVLNEGYYKVALYPHCFFLKDNVIKTIDFYSCVGIKEQYIERNILEGLIGNDSVNRFNQSTENNFIDFKKFFEITMTKHLNRTWKDNPFPEFYKRLL